MSHMITEPKEWMHQVGCDECFNAICALRKVLSESNQDKIAIVCLKCLKVWRLKNEQPVSASGICEEKKGSI